MVCLVASLLAPAVSITLSGIDQSTFDPVSACHRCTGVPGSRVRTVLVIRLVSNVGFLRVLRAERGRTF